MANSVTDAQARSFIEQVVDKAADQVRFESRRRSYPLLTELGCLPPDLDGILIEDGPSVFHSLAFRMATYSGETLFNRWEQLLSQACKFEGWESEYSNWSSLQDHWAMKWNKFNQFLWMLQCCEYFVDKGAEVSFPYSEGMPTPDIHVAYGDGSELFVECYHYTKWWGTEQLVEDLLFAIDPDLRIERMHNLTYENNRFADDPENAVVELLAELGKYLTPDRLANLKKQSGNHQPIEVCKLGNFFLLLEGAGVYSGRHNAHGDPKASWPVFRDEILRNKYKSNGLETHRPNLLMVNCLGLDFQFSLNENSKAPCLPSSLDEVWFCACGIDDKIEASRRLKVNNAGC